MVVGTSVDSGVPVGAPVVGPCSVVIVVVGVVVVVGAKVVVVVA